MALIYNKEIYN